ncbi:nitroreductase family protein [Larkinella sp. C7]|jgi:SagB-type dehydrogenase family enzyme|uniref:nitroreductase family protein n=1 Tax=Larkinella sp. C7 TaxID=2576607 RepID=UPI0011110B56|nr:nitroreductase family protein [Larkinella sp. C7]
MNNPIPKAFEEPYSPILYPIAKKKYLKEPSLKPEDSFLDVLVNRRTYRKFVRLSEDQLSAILWHSAKATELQFQENGFIWSHRPCPSAGGRHPIDLIISQPEAINTRKLALYNPIDHSLNELTLDTTQCLQFIEHINEVVPIGDATIIWFIADQFRTESKYINPLSLIWRDAGAFLNSLQLVCCAFKIACCPLGSLGEPFISDLFGEYTPMPIFGVGGCLVG